MGADDYVVNLSVRANSWPRIRAILRVRPRSPNRAVVRGCRGSIFDSARQAPEDEIRLTRAEFNLLAFFLQNPGKALSAT